MLELLNQLDGFDTRGDVKVIMATNKIESLDPALIRPGRIDRKIEFPLPDIKTKRHIFKYAPLLRDTHRFTDIVPCRLHTSRMNLSEDVDLEEFVTAKDDLSGADIKAVCTEAGLLALRERRMRVTKTDFSSAREKVYSPFCLMLVDADRLSPAGALQEERGHAGGSLPVIVPYFRLLCFVSSLFVYGPCMLSARWIDEVWTKLASRSATRPGIRGVSYHFLTCRSRLWQTLSDGLRVLPSNSSTRPQCAPRSL